MVELAELRLGRRRDGVEERRCCRRAAGGAAALRARPRDLSELRGRELEACGASAAARALTRAAAASASERERSPSSAARPHAHRSSAAARGANSSAFGAAAAATIARARASAGSRAAEASAQPKSASSAGSSVPTRSSLAQPSMRKAAAASGGRRTPAAFAVASARASVISRRSFTSSSRRSGSMRQTAPKSGAAAVAWPAFAIAASTSIAPPTASAGSGPSLGLGSFRSAARAAAAKSAGLAWPTATKRWRVDASCGRAVSSTRASKAEDAASRTKRDSAAILSPPAPVSVCTIEPTSARGSTSIVRSRIRASAAACSSIHARRSAASFATFLSRLSHVLARCFASYWSPHASKKPSSRSGGARMHACIKPAGLRPPLPGPTRSFRANACSGPTCWNVHVPSG